MQKNTKTTMERNFSENGIFYCKYILEKHLKTNGDLSCFGKMKLFKKISQLTKNINKYFYTAIDSDYIDEYLDVHLLNDILTVEINNRFYDASKVLDLLYNFDISKIDSGDYDSALDYVENILLM